MTLGELLQAATHNLSSLLKFVALQMLFIYQRSFALIFGGSCRFYPSCSHYAKEAYESHGFMRATLLVFQRLSKCRPGGPYGVDLVPKPNGVSHGY